MTLVKKIKDIVTRYYFLRKERRNVIKTLNDISNYLQPLGVHILYVQLPIYESIRGLTQFEKERHKFWSFDQNKYREEMSKLKRIYGDDITPEYVLSVFDGGIVVQGSKRKILLDFESKYQHIINGRRVTTGQPKQYLNTIYTHGACTWRGTGVEDSQTIASFLQANINLDFPNSYRVVNSAIGRGSSLCDDYYHILEQQYQPNDIVMLGSFGEVNYLPAKTFESIGISYITTSQLFHRPHNYGEWFNDNVLHTNSKGNKVIAGYIFDSLKKLEWLKKTSLGAVDNRKQDFLMLNKENLVKGERIYGDNPELIRYINNLESLRKGSDKSVCGSIVMNCNPFTLGHRYLIEYAASKVDYLYIFVVEEDRSYFTFCDRFELVKKGTANLENVIVLPSGNFIISATTFPGYFYKDNLKEAKIDCSNDLNIFCQYIAPALNIKIRFAGQEPIDPITNQYNEAMAEILPQYGIQFHAIERKIEGESVISASRVRKYFEAGELEKIKNIVPLSTFEYLSNRYKSEHND